MPIATETYQQIDDLISRLAGESILAQPGRDEGLIPSYSLLNELRELCAAEPALVTPVAKVRGDLDRLLDAAQPFDGPTLGKLRRLIEWLPDAVEHIKEGRAPAEFSGSPNTTPPMAAGGAPAAHAAPDDVMLELPL